MAGIEPDQFGLRQIALERLGAGRDEERVVLAPYNQRSWLILAERVVPVVVECDIGLIVFEQVELIRVGAGTIEQCLVDRPVVRADRLGNFRADLILELCRSAVRKPRAAASVVASRLFHNGRKTCFGMSPTPSR